MPSSFHARRGLMALAAALVLAAPTLQAQTAWPSKQW